MQLALSKLAPRRIAAENVARSSVDFENSARAALRFQSRVRRNAVGFQREHPCTFPARLHTTGGGRFEDETNI